MKFVRRWLRVAVIVAANLILLIGSSTQGVLWLGQASAHAAVPPGAQSTGRFVPDIHAPTLPTSAWYPHDAGHPGTAKQTPTSSHVSAAGRQPGEQADLRTAATSTYLNPDGTWTLDAYSAPIHYQDAQGRWQNIDNTIVGDTSDAGYTYGNKANAWHVHFAQTAGGPKLIHVTYPGLNLAETLDGAAAAAAAANGPEITYPAVFSGVDLVYQVLHARLEELLLLHNAQAPATYSFTYHVPGLTASQDAQGNIIFTDGSGKAVLVIGGVQAYEADPQGDMLHDAQATTAVTVQLSGKAPDYTVALTPDHNWLADPARRFPVAIDPTWTLSGADGDSSTSNGNIYGDTFDESGNPTWGFYTTNTERIGNCNAVPSGTTGYGTGTNRSYIKFPVNPAPAGAHVTSATLKLYQLSSYAGSAQIDANLLLQSWNETTLTWNTHPTSWSFMGSGNASTTYNVWATLNVTNAIYTWWQAGTALNGLELGYHNESLACDLFASDDRGISNELPTLSINYVQDTTAPSGGLTVNGGATYTNSTNVSLGPSNYSDPGANDEWSANWSSVNGVTKITTGSSSDANQPAAWSVDAAGTQLTSDTSTCGGTACWVQTYFSHTIGNMANYPTFTAMFKTDSLNDFEFGAESSSNAGTRFMLHSNSSGFSAAMVSTASGSWANHAVSYALSTNTWYYGQVDFPLSNVGEFYIWPVGQPRPAKPTYWFTGLYMTNPGLIFQHNGDNATNLHHFVIGNVYMTSKNTSTGTIGYGISQAQFSNDGTTWSCPAPAGGAWCVADDVQRGWLMLSGDGAKTVYVKYRDNAGLVSGAGSDVITLDTTSPTASVTAPAAGRELRGIVTVGTSFSDPLVNNTNSGVQQVALYCDGTQVGTPIATQSGATSAQFLWDTTNVAGGEHTLTVQATDNAGNTGISAGIVVDVSNTGQMPYETFAMRDLPAGGTSVGANVANGAGVVTHQDLDIPGRGPDLSIGRSYSDLAPINNLFGFGWTSDLDEAVQANPDGSVTYRDPSGGFHVFLPNGSGGYVTPPGLYLTLVKNADATYVLTSHDQTRTTFNAAGYITSIADRNGNTLSIAYDASNLPTTMTDASGRQLTITTSGGHITQIAAPGARSYTYSYDGSGNLTDFIEDPGTSGQLDTHYAYDSAHRLTAITLNYVSGGAQDQQTNVTTTLTYDSNNRLVQVLDPLGYDADIQYGAPGSGQTTVEQLWNGSASNPPACYDNSTGSGNYQCTTYTETGDGSGAIESITDPLGNLTQYHYDGNEDLMQVTSPAGRATSYTYDASGNQLSRTVDPGTGQLNLTTTWSYDSANDVLTETDPADANGYQRGTQYTYDGNGDLMQKVEGYVGGAAASSDTNVTTSYTYDAYGELLTETDPLGIVTQYTYDSQGDVTETIQNYVSGGAQDSQTNVETFATYDALGQKLTTTDALGYVTQNTYDIRGNLMQTVANWVPGAGSNSTTNVTTQYGYDPLDRQVSVTNPLGIVTESVYDADGRVTKSIRDYVSGGPTDSQTNVTTTTTYDDAGNATVSTDATGNTTTTTYDADNRATDVMVKSGPNASPANAEVKDTQTVYDNDGQTTSTTVYDFTNNGTNSQTTSYTYDTAGRRVTEQDPPASGSSTGNVTTTTYDGAGNVTETLVTNGSGGSTVSDTTATFDHLGRMLTKVENPGASNAQTTTYTYDADGRQLSLKDTAGNVTGTTYDALGRSVTVTHPDGSKDTTTYDADGHRLTQANAAGTTTDTYDALGRLSSEQQADGTGTLQSTVTYTYDANGNKLSQTTTPASGTPSTTSWTYDKLDRTATMSDGTRSYVYDANGNLTQMQVFNGGTQTVQAQYAYDGGNRLTTLKDFAGAGSSTPLHSYSYAYDAAGNRNSITEDGTTTTYTYDGENQLLSVSSGGVTQASYTYDANHNRATMATPAGTTSYTYDTTSTDTLLQQKTDPDGKVTNYAYDSNGNLLTATYDPAGANQVTTYRYDSSNRLTEIDEPNGTIVSFGYDANGQRVKKTVQTGGSNPTMSVVNDVYQSGHLAYQTNLGGTVLATFTYNPSDEPESVVVGSDPVNGPRYYYVYNGHGDVVALTDGSGNVVASYTYDAFGTITSVTENIPNANGWSNPYRYDGKDGARYDAETSLYWLSTRAYDSTLGRFLQRDPLGRAPLFFPDQPYTYAGNNPLINVDPSGQRFFQEGMTAKQQQQAARQMQRAARMWARRVPPCNRKCWSDRAKGVANRTAADFAILAGGAALAAIAAAGLAWFLTDIVVPFVLAVAAASLLGFVFFVGVAAVLSFVALMLRQMVSELAVLAAEATVLSGLFWRASAEDTLSYGYVSGWWKKTVIATIIVGTVGGVLAGLRTGLGKVADAIRAVGGLLSRTVMKQVFSYLATLTAIGSSSLSFTYVASEAFGALYEMESDLR